MSTISDALWRSHEATCGTRSTSRRSCGDLFLHDCDPGTVADAQSRPTRQSASVMAEPVLSRPDPVAAETLAAAELSR